MSGWYCVETVTFRVKQEGGKGVKQQAVDMKNPEKSLEALEDAVGFKCPEERRKELLNKLRAAPNQTPHWVAQVEVPEWYTTADPSDVTNALRWGCELVEKHKHLGESKLSDQLNLEWKKKLEQTEEVLAQYKRDIQQAVAQKDAEIKAWQTAAVNNLSASGLEAKVQAAKQEWEENQLRLIQSLERERETHAKTAEELKTKVNSLEADRDRLYEQLKQRDTAMSKSAVKGSVGEDLVDDWLHKAFYGATITDTSRETNKMDRHIDYNGVKIIVDSKHHDGRLHSIHDVQKFYDNIGHNPDAQIAILLCTSTTVPHHCKFWVETEWINDTQLAVFMNKVSENPIERLQLIAGTIIQPWKEYLQQRKRLSDSIAGDELKVWTDKAKTVLMNGWEMVARLQEQWGRTHKTIQTSMKEFQDLLAQEAQAMQGSLRELGMDADVSTKKGKRAKVQ